LAPAASRTRRRTTTLALARSRCIKIDQFLPVDKSVDSGDNF